MLRLLGKNVLQYAAADFLFRLVQLIAVPIYAHLLSVSDFGIMALLTSSSTLIGMFLNLGINNAVQRFYFDAGPDVRRRAMLVSTGLLQLVISGGLVVSLLYLGLRPFSAEIQTRYGIEWVLVVISLATIVPDQIAQYSQDVARLQFAPLRFCLIALVRNLLGVLIGLWLIADRGWGITGILAGSFAGSALAVPVGLLMTRRDLTIALDRLLARRLLSYGYPFIFAGAAYWIFGSMDRWLLTEFSNLEQVGLFSIALKFAGVLTFASSAFAQAWSPFAMRLYAEDPGYREAYARTLSGWFFVLAFVGLGIALLAPEIMKLLTPPMYWGAAPVISIATGGLVFYGTVQITVLGISLERRTILITWGAWLAAGVNVGVNLILIPRIGALGAAVATFMSYAVLTSAFLFWSQRLHPIPLPRTKLLYSLGLVCMGAIVAPALAPLGTGATIVSVKALILLAAVAGAFVCHVLDPSLWRSLLSMLQTQDGTGAKI